MIKRSWNYLAAIAAAAALSTATCFAAGKPAPKGPSGAALELADRLESMAYDAAERGRGNPDAWREVAALLQGAERLNPTEPRFPRRAFQVCQSGGDVEGSQAALLAYLTLVPDDQYAQIKLIDLYVNKMQTAESMLKYLRGIVTKAALPAPVRAHAAVVCAQTLLERSQNDEAIKYLNTALQIEPVCIAALRMKYSLTADEGPAHRCGLLLAMLRANPMDGDTGTALAAQLAMLGLPEPSAIWYSEAAQIYGITSRPRSRELAKGAATELYLCNHPADAQQLLDVYLNSIPDDTEAWMIRLAIAEDTATSTGSFQALAHRGINSAIHALQSVRSALGDERAADAAAADENAATTQSSLLSGPTTAPATQPLAETPDLSNDMQLLVKADQPRLTDAYINALGDLAWMRLYFLRDAGPDTQRVVDALSKLLQPDDPLLVRLAGWTYLDRGQWAEAKQKLSAVSDRDPEAALGMILVDDQAGDRAAGDALARITLATHPSGAIAAILFSAVHGRGAKIIPLPQADVVQAEVQAFPHDWLNIFVQPQEFYTITAEPLDREVGFEQAILARVTIQNISNYDITLGDQGTLRSEMVFDAVTRGLIEKQLGQTAADQFWQRLDLAKGQFASQVVRLDRGDLGRLLDSQPDVPIDVQFTVLFNPIPGDHQYVVGPAGCRVPFVAMVERTPTPTQTPDDRKKLFDLLSKGKPAQRLLAASATGTFYVGLRNAAQGVTIDQTLGLAQEMFDHARQAENDPDPYVKAWAEYVGVVISPASRQPDLLAKLAQSDDWYARLLALVAAQKLADQGAAAATAMANDPDPVVKDYATAVSDRLKAIAATQPSGQN